MHQKWLEMEVGLKQELIFLNFFTRKRGRTFCFAFDFVMIMQFSNTIYSVNIMIKSAVSM